METVMVAPIELIDRMLEQGEDIYEAAVSIGIQNENELTVQRWLQGDLVLRVAKQYGEGIVVKFATALNVNTSTLKQRRTMSHFYEKDTRYLFDDLGYSHFREAMRLGDMDSAVEALRHASENDMPVWEFAKYIDLKLGKEKEPAPNIPGEISDVYKRDGVGVVEILIALDDMAYIKSGSMVNLKPKEL